MLVAGTDIHRVKYRERDRLAIHYHQSYQVRRFRKVVPSFLLAASPSKKPMVHLFDEPQFNPQDGYIGFMLDFFRKLRAEGRLVFVCLHPTASYHLEILSEIAERFLLVSNGGVTPHPTFKSLIGDERCQDLSRAGNDPRRRRRCHERLRQRPGGAGDRRGRRDGACDRAACWRPKVIASRWPILPGAKLDAAAAGIGAAARGFGFDVSDPAAD